MASWKKIIVSGSNAELNQITASNDIKLVGNISGSITSTGSFGRAVASTGSFGRVVATKFVGDGSGITGLTSAAIETYNTSGDNRIITSVDSSTVQGESNLTFDGSTLGVTGAVTSTGAITADGEITSKGNIVAQGDVIANRYIVSSSVSIITSSFSSGSTIFGDSIDDTHEFTGSLKITGSQVIAGRITPTEIGAFTAKGAIDFDNQNLTNIDIDSGDIASGVTINKSPVVNFNSGDVQGSITLTNLATGTGALTIQADAVEGSMVHSNVVDDSTLEQNGTQFRIKDAGVDENKLNTSVAGTGIAGGGGSALSVDFTELTGQSPTFTNLTLTGNLVVKGTSSTIATTNLEVKDAFGFFATGSAAANVDAGIIVQSGSATDSGSAIYHDISSERWGVAKGVASDATTVTDTEWQGFVATVFTSSGSPVGQSPKYGVGEMHIDENGEIYIYS